MNSPSKSYAEAVKGQAPQIHGGGDTRRRTRRRQC